MGSTILRKKIHEFQMVECLVTSSLISILSINDLRKEKIMNRKSPGGWSEIVQQNEWWRARVSMIFMGEVSKRLKIKGKVAHHLSTHHSNTPPFLYYQFLHFFFFKKKAASIDHLSLSIKILFSFFTIIMLSKLLPLLLFNPFDVIFIYKQDLG